MHIHNLLRVALAQDMIGDANPMVVANAVAALSEIQEISGKEGVFRIDSNSLFKLLRALNECTEWGQVRRHSVGVEAAMGEGVGGSFFFKPQL